MTSRKPLQFRDLFGALDGDLAGDRPRTLGNRDRRSNATFAGQSNFIHGGFDIDPGETPIAIQLPDGGHGRVEFGGDEHVAFREGNERTHSLAGTAVAPVRSIPSTLYQGAFADREHNLDSSPFSRSSTDTSVFQNPSECR